MPQMQAKIRKKSYAQPEGKLCIKCGKKKKYSQFYKNTDWQRQDGYDCWCKACYGQCKKRQDVQRYYWENNKKWSDQAWDSAKKRALGIISDNSVYKKSNQERRVALLERLTCQQLTSIYPMFYCFEDHDGKTFQQSIADGQTEVTVDPFMKRYSAEWNGQFTNAELAYLQKYYHELEQDFNFTDASQKDYAQKVCRASMQMNRAMDDFQAGRCDYSVVKDAMSVFDMLNKSSNFAACKRKQGDTGGITCWAQTSLYLETHGFPMTTKIQWPQDDVDKVSQLYRNYQKSVGFQ